MLSVLRGRAAGGASRRLNGAGALRPVSRGFHGQHICQRFLDFLAGRAGGHGRHGGGQGAETRRDGRTVLPAGVTPPPIRRQIPARPIPGDFPGWSDAVAVGFMERAAQSISHIIFIHWHTAHLVTPFQDLIKGCDPRPRALPWAFMFWAFSPHVGVTRLKPGRVGILPRSKPTRAGSGRQGCRPPRQPRMPDATLWRRASLPAVEPGFPARRKKACANRGALEFCHDPNRPTPVPGGRDAALHVRQGCLTPQNLLKKSCEIPANRQLKAKGLSPGTELTETA